MPAGGGGWQTGVVESPEATGEPDVVATAGPRDAKTREPDLTRRGPMDVSSEGG